MPRIRSMPDDVALDLKKPVNLLKALLKARIPIAHACGGQARCSTCRIEVLDGLDHCAPRTTAEEQMAARLKFTDELRLACQTKIEGDVRVRRLVLDNEDIELTSQLEVGEEEEDLSGVGHEHFVAVLFADVRGFTAMAEALPAYDVVHLLNRFFVAAGRVIDEHDGTISNYMGDGLMALFGLEDEGAAPAQAIRAGLALLEVARGIDRYYRDAYGCTFSIRIGAHCGPAVVGGIGATGQRREAAIGDTVNVASRIEAVNKETQTEFLVSDALRQGIVEGIRFGDRFEVSLKGKSGRITVHEVLGTEP